MTRSIHPFEENHVRSHSGMKLSARSLFLATAVTTGILYLICILFVLLVHQLTMAFFSSILHANLTGITLTVTWGNFVTGFLFWSIGIGLYAALLARLYNRFLFR
jgi:hypothetical protein